MEKGMGERERKEWEGAEGWEKATRGDENLGENTPRG